MDLNGDHALCCKKSGDRITRHNRLRNLVFKLADTGLLRPEMEKLGILGPTDKSRRRPGDVSIKDWSFRRGLAIDVAVICPLAAPHLTLRSPVSRMPSIRKSIDTPLLLRSLNYDFAPVVFETSGAVNKEGENVLKQIIRFASNRERNHTHRFCLSRLGASFLLCSTAQQILNRRTC